MSLSTGFPFSPQLGYNPTGSGDSRNPVRPNVNPNFTGKLYPGGSTAQKVAQYFNPNAFSAPAYGTVGNAGRDSLVGPGYANWDFSLLKSTQLTQRFRLQFRAEFFNLLNHANLSLPNEVVFSNGPTQGTTANQTTPAALGTPGVVTATANTSRQIQLGLKTSLLACKPVSSCHPRRTLSDSWRQSPCPNPCPQIAWKPSPTESSP